MAKKETKVEEKAEAKTAVKAAPKKEAKAPAKEAKKAKKSNDAILETTDLRAKKPEELQAALLELKKEQFNLRFQQKSGELKNPIRIRQVRRNIAKIKTVTTENTNKEAANA